MNPFKYLKSFLSVTPNQIYKSKAIFNGGYLFLNKSKINEERIKKKLEIHSDENEKIGFTYLNRMVQKNKGTLFILIRTPMHHNYTGRKNEKSFQECIHLLRKNRNCKLIDFNKIDFADSCFADDEHLNFKGAKLFTPIFLDSINKYLQ